MAFGTRYCAYVICLVQSQDRPFYHLPVKGFVIQVLEAEYDVQKAIAPFLKVPALRTVIQTFTNDADGDFQKWAGNPAVLEMLMQAKQLLDKGRMTEAEMEHAFLECCNVRCKVSFASDCKLKLPVDVVS